MNSTTLHPRFATALAYSLLLVVLAGCNNNDTPTTDLDLPGELVEVAIIANGIESFVDTPDAAATRSAWLPANEQTVHTQAQPLPDGHMMVVTATSAQATATATRAITLKNTTLRVVAYTAAGEYVDDCLYAIDNTGSTTPQVGQSLMVPVRAMPYTFYCYSPGTLACNTEKQQVAVDTHDDFAFAKQFAVVDGRGSSPVVSIPTLQLKSGRIGVKVTCEGGPVECTPTLSGTSYDKYSTFDMTGGDYEQKTLVNTPSFPLPSGNAEIAFPVGEAKMGLNMLTLSFLKSQLVADGEKISVYPVKLPDYQTILSPGSRLTIAVNIFRSRPNVDFVIVGDLRVAKGNLMRANGTGHWFLAPDQGYYTGSVTGGDYFSWGIDNPTYYSSNTYGASMENVSKGCAAVLGAGWRVPTKAENGKLAAGDHVWGTYKGQRGESNGMYFGTNRVPSAADQDYYAFLPAAGNRSDNGSMDYVSSGGYYWSSEFSASSEAYYLYFSNSTVNGTNYYFYCSRGQSVRCVTDY